MWRPLMRPATWRLPAEDRAIEAFDEKIVGAILRGMKEFECYKILVLPDHPTPISLRTHAGDPVPYVIYSDGGRLMAMVKPSMKSPQEQVQFYRKGFELIERFLAPCGNG